MTIWSNSEPSNSIRCQLGHPEKRLIPCPNMKEAYSDFHGERYRCEVCGQTVRIDYEEMR